VSKVHIREREKVFDNDGNLTGYTQTQGDSYTVERLMPTPYKLTIKADIWSTNTDQKLQIMEQILMLFNPSLEIQTTDNFIDWTSLSVVEITDITFSSRTIPVGADSEIDIGSLSFETPIWISPPTKVKKLGVVTDIVMNIFDEGGRLSDALDGVPRQEFVNIGNYGVLVYNNTVSLLKNINSVQEDDTSDTVFTKGGPEISWQAIFEQYPGKFRNDVSQLFLIQENGNRVVGRLMKNPADPDDSTVLYVNWDQDTFPTDTLITSTLSPNGRTVVNAVIDPTRYNPRPRLPDGTLGWPENGIRYLVLEDIGFFRSEVFSIAKIGLEKNQTQQYIIPGGVANKFYIQTDINYQKSVLIEVDDEEKPGQKIKKSILVDNVYSHKVFIKSVQTGRLFSIPGTVIEDSNGKCRITVNYPISDEDEITLEVTYTSRLDADLSTPEVFDLQSANIAAAWANLNQTIFTARANDIIEWTGTKWEVVLDSSSEDVQAQPVYVTNLRTGIQYKLTDNVWSKSFEGEYPKGMWRLVF
jgi:hypothetical protein